MQNEKVNIGGTYGNNEPALSTCHTCLTSIRFPVSWPPNVKMDLNACAAVREAVGTDIRLMIDAVHWYSRTDALALGRGLEA